MASILLCGDSPVVDWSLLSFGANDAAPWKQVPLHEFRDNLGALIDRCRSEHVLVLPPTPVIERADARSAERARGGGAGTVGALRQVRCLRPGGLRVAC